MKPFEWLHTDPAVKNVPLELIQTVQYMLEQNVRFTTNKSYNSAVKHYEKFCNKYKLQMYPIRSVNYMLYIADSLHNIKASSIKTYMNGINYHAKLNGFPVDIESMPHVKMCRKALTTVFDGSNKKQRKPYLWEHYIEDFAKYGIQQYDNLVYFTALAGAMLSIMRPSEYLAKRQNVNFDDINDASARTLYIKNLKIVNEDNGKLHYIVLKCRLVKTAKTLEDVEIVWSKGKWPLSPADLVLKMLKMRSKLAKQNAKLKIEPKAKLFVLEDGKVLTQYLMKKWFNKLIEARGWEVTQYSLYAAKDGAVTSLARRDATPQVLTMVGRWQSDCYKPYTKLSHADIANKLYTFTTKPVVDPNVVYLYDPQVGYQVRR